MFRFKTLPRSYSCSLPCSTHTRSPQPSAPQLSLSRQALSRAASSDTCAEPSFLLLLPHLTARPPSDHCRRRRRAHTPSTPRRRTLSGVHLSLPSDSRPRSAHFCRWAPTHSSHTRSLPPPRRLSPASPLATDRLCPFICLSIGRHPSVYSSDTLAAHAPSLGLLRVAFEPPVLLPTISRHWRRSKLVHGLGRHSPAPVLVLTEWAPVPRLTVMPTDWRAR